MVHPTLQPQNNLSPTQIPGSFVSNSLKLPSLAQQLVLPHPVFSQTKMTAPKGNHSQVVVSCAILTAKAEVVSERKV